MKIDRILNILFLCTGNSARSIMAEALVNHWGHGKFRAFSAGSLPTGKVNPYALDILDLMCVPANDPRSKSWNEFVRPDAPVMDIIITVCDSAAGEICPIWPGRPMTAHWGVADPAAVTGNETVKINAFRSAFHELEERIKLFTSLPIHQMDKSQLQRQLDDIGRKSSIVVASISNSNTGDEVIPR